MADTRGLVAEELRSTDLANCLHLIVGEHAQDVFVHIACDENGELDGALLKLSEVGGIVRATLVSLTRGAD